MLPNYFGPHIEYGSEEHQAVLKKVLRNIVGVIRISVIMCYEPLDQNRQISFK